MDIFHFASVFHCLIGTGYVMCAAQCKISVLVSLFLGGLFTPSAYLLVNVNRKWWMSVGWCTATAITAFTLAAGIKYFDECNERLIFMAMIDGMIIPGAIFNFISILN